jgi:23S rRNA (adenine-N6)-dimethyltransferase
VPGSGRRTWGWHRLDDQWAARLVRAAGVGRGDLVLDVGAGAGALTEPLVAAGAHVIAVELHAVRAEELRARFAGRPVTVVRADAADLRLPRRPFHVVANPPYGVASALLRRLVAPGSRLVTAHVVVPRGMANLWLSGRAPGAGRWMRQFDARLGLIVPRWAFQPPPKTDSAVLVLCRR